MLLGICLMFCQFSPGAAYKSVAYDRKRVIEKRKKTNDQARQGEACNFAKSNTAPCVLFTFLKLYKWYQIA